MEDSQDTLNTVDTNFALFCIAPDEKLTFIKKYDVQASDKYLQRMDALK